ncbi:MAG: TIGR03663 family protein [Phycisphaeraceae bacterium]|nr:TIGR03663 family protein [Phycisphaeraceae bacterium]
MILLIGVLVRQNADLGHRPMHADEAVHAVRMATLLEHGRFQYDPTEFHGPSLYYLSYPVLRIQGRSDLASFQSRDPRLIPLLALVTLIALSALLIDGLSRIGVAAAALLTATSPAMAYYGGYFIHELVLVLATFLVIASVWRYLQRPRLRWMIIAGLSLGLMHATKATCIIAWFAMLVGLAACLIRPSGARPKDTVDDPSQPTPFKRLHVVWGLVAAVAFSVVLFSGGFTHMRGPIDSVLAWGPYFGRGMGTAGDAAIHVHPWDTYLRQLLHWRFGNGPIWSQAVIVAFALVGAAGVLIGRRDVGGPNPMLLRFLAVYTLIMLTIYSLIPYKTPWLVLGMLHGMILLAGGGVGVLWHLLRNPLPRVAVVALLLAGSWHLHTQTQRALSPRLAADPRNPYAYAHTGTAINRLEQRINDLVQHHPQGRDMIVHVICENYWPLPWYLRSLNHVGYWHDVAVDYGLETDPSREPAIILVELDKSETVNAMLNRPMHREFFGLRPGVLLMAYIDAELWDAFIETRR